MNEPDPIFLKNLATQCPGFQARATARAITRYYNACFKPFALTAEQFSLLVGIGAAEGTTLAALAINAGVDATTLSRSTQKLESQGFIHTEGGRGRTGKKLMLTHTGKSLLTEMLPVWETATADLSRQLGDQQLHSTVHAMSTLAKALTL